MLPKHRHREAHRSRLVRLGCEVMEDRVLLSAGLPDYHFTAPALVAGSTQHNAPSSIGAFTKTPGGTTQRIVSNGSMTAVLPAAPSFTAKAVSATQINLAWTPVAGATSYLVDEWINGAWKQIGSPGSGSTGYAATGLSPNTTYYFDVAASNAAGTTWANSYQSTSTFPAAPSFTARAVSATQINLAWTPVAGATGYLVNQWINGAWKQICSLGSGSTGYAVTGLSPNTTYYFEVGAPNAAGTTWASYQSATTLTSSPVVNWWMSLSALQRQGVWLGLTPLERLGLIVLPGLQASVQTQFLKSSPNQQKIALDLVGILAAIDLTSKISSVQSNVAALVSVARQGSGPSVAQLNGAAMKKYYGGELLQAQTSEDLTDVEVEGDQAQSIGDYGDDY